METAKIKESSYAHFKVTDSKNEFSLNSAIQAMAIEFTNIAAKRQLISVSEFRPILDIIFAFCF